MYISLSASRAYIDHNLKLPVILGDLNYGYKLSETLASKPIHVYIFRTVIHVQPIDHRRSSRDTKYTNHPTCDNSATLSVPVTGELTVVRSYPKDDSHTKSDVLKCGLGDHTFVYTIICVRYSESQRRIVTSRKYK